MANKGMTDVVSSFESTFAEKTELPSGLVDQWFIDALAEFELETESTGYDEDTEEFPAGFPQYKVKILGLLMKMFYCERELSRVNKLNNIIGKDVSFNGTGDTKRFTESELKIEMKRVLDALHKLKTTCYA